MEWPGQGLRSAAPQLWGRYRYSAGESAQGLPAAAAPAAGRRGRPAATKCRRGGRGRGRPACIAEGIAAFLCGRRCQGASQGFAWQPSCLAARPVGCAPGCACRHAANRCLRSGSLGGSPELAAGAGSVWHVGFARKAAPPACGLPAAASSPTRGKRPQQRSGEKSKASAHPKSGRALRAFSSMSKRAIRMPGLLAKSRAAAGHPR